MPTTYVPKLIVGWKIDYKKTAEWLKKYNVGSCDTEQCFCGFKYCWDASKIPDYAKHLCIIATNPYDGCSTAEMLIFLSLTSQTYLTTTEMNYVANEQELIERGRKLAQELKCDNEEFNELRTFPVIDVI